MKIVSNLQSLNAINELNKVNQSLGVHFKRLSSGLRINGASDDSAGLSISTRITSQIRGLQTAQRNTNDYISLFQTAEGGLSEIENNLQRMRELSIQSASESYNENDRQAIQLEITQLKDQIQKIATTTHFNNVNILDGGMLQKLAQIGHSSQSQESVTIQSAQTNYIGHHNRIDSQVGVFASRFYDFTIQDLGAGDSSLTFVVDQEEPLLVNALLLLRER